MSSLFDKLVLRTGIDPATVAKNSAAGKLFASHGVRDTAELRRVLDLPRRRWEQGIGGKFGTPDELALLLTQAFKREGGTQTLRSVQAACLSELHDFGGLIAPIRVGGGKTLISFLAPKVLECKRPLLLIPAKLRKKTEREWFESQRNWVLPGIRVESYELLGRSQHSEFLNNYAPDLIIADETHRLKNRKAAITRRVIRYFDHNPGTKFVGMSGTITKRSLDEYWHLLRWALGDAGMPMPRLWNEMVEWGGCLNVAGNTFTRNAPGALTLFCNKEETEALKHGEDAAVTAVRRAYQRRLTETPGVVSTVDTQVACSLSISQVDLDLEHLSPYFHQLRTTWETPDGHPFSEAVDLWRHARELICGFYYVWDPRPPKEWLNARSAWCKLVRDVLSHSRRWDSEMQVAQAVRKGECDAEFQNPATGETFGAEKVLANWVAVRDTFKVNQVAYWIDDTVLEHAHTWLSTPGRNGIVWTEHVAFADRLSGLGNKFPYYGRGGIDQRTGKVIEQETGPCIASILANGEGRNLQRYNENLVVSCPPNGGVWEQLCGRTHRDGQQADEVTVDVILGCKEAWGGFQNALRDARYAEESTGQNQKLIFADKTIETIDEVALKTGSLWK